MHRSISEQNASDSPRAARPVNIAGIDVLLLVDLKRWVNYDLRAAD